MFRDQEEAAVNKTENCSLTDLLRVNLLRWKTGIKRPWTLVLSHTSSLMQVIMFIISLEKSKEQ